MNKAYLSLKMTTILSVFSFIHVTITSATQDQLSGQSDHLDLKRQYFEQSLQTVFFHHYDERLSRIRDFYDVCRAKIFVLYTAHPDTNKWIQRTFVPDLGRIGFPVSYAAENQSIEETATLLDHKLKRSLFVIAVCTPDYLQSFQAVADPLSSSRIHRDVHLLAERSKNEYARGKILAVFRHGTVFECIPPPSIGTCSSRYADT